MRIQKLFKPYIGDFVIETLINPVSEKNKENYPISRNVAKQKFPIWARSNMDGHNIDGMILSPYKVDLGLSEYNNIFEINGN